MAKRKAKKTTKEPSSKDLTTEEQQHVFSDHEVERRITAIRAIRDAEIEHLLTRLRLLRSYLTKEQLDTPLLHFFKENCPNLLVVKNDDGELELEMKIRDCSLPASYADERYMQAPPQRASVSCSDLAAVMPNMGDLEFSSKSVKEHFVTVASMQIPDFMLKENSETQMLGLQDSFQTPGITGQKLSIGMTPKTLRLPKHGEMLLSVRGSPLGVYREDNMEAIAESEEA